MGSEIRQASIGYLLFRYYRSITGTIDRRQKGLRILDAWEYINRRLAGTSIGEVERALDELEMVGIMRNGSLITTEWIDSPHHMPSLVTWYWDSEWVFWEAGYNNIKMSKLLREPQVVHGNRLHFTGADFRYGPRVLLLAFFFFSSLVRSSSSFIYSSSPKGLS